MQRESRRSFNAKLLDGFNSLGRGADLMALAASGAVSGALADDIVAA